MLQTAAGLAGGAANGGLGGAAGAGSGVYLLNKLMRSTLWRTVSAASKAQLVNALASGSADTVVAMLSKWAGEPLTASLGGLLFEVLESWDSARVAPRS